MVGPIDVKRKGSALVEHWVQYITLTFDLTHDLDLGCFKVKFWNSSISGNVCLIELKWKGSELIWYWADCMTLAFDHIHDLDLGFSRSASEIALSQEWGSRLIMNEKDVSHPFMTMILTCVTMVRWADVPDSDRGDFRRWRAVDISSCFWSVAAAAAVLPTLFNFSEKLLKLISSNHTQLTYGCGNIFWHLSRWPWVKVTKLPKRDAIYHVPTIKWEPLIQSIQNLVGISPLCFTPD